MNLGSTVHNEQRLAKRKILKVKVFLTMEGGETVLARSIDVSGEGVCLAVPHGLKSGAICMVRFDLFHEGRLVPIAARSRVQYCILSAGEYKCGFRFVNVDLSAMAALSKFLH